MLKCRSRAGWSVGMSGVLALASVAHGQLCDGLSARWAFDGGVLTDLSGNGHTLTSNGALFVAGIVGEAARTTDAPATFLQTPNAPLLNPTQAISLCAWVRDTSPGSGNEPIIDKGATSHSAPFYQYHLGVASDFLFDLAINNTRRTIRGGSTTPGVWRFVVATFDGSTMRLYVNAEQVSSLSVAGSITTFGRPVYLGRFTNLSNSTDATMDEVRIYGRALSVDEVTFLFASPTGRPFISPAAPNVCGGGTAVFASIAGGGPGLSTTWEFADPADPGTWTTVAEGANTSGADGTVLFTATGAATDTLSVSQVGARTNGVRFRSVVIGTCGVQTSAEAVLTVCPTDYNCDGILSPDDLDEFITTYFIEPPDNATADFNNDGIVSPDDLDEFITAYFEGC